MDHKRFEDIMDIVLNKNNANAKLKKLGLTKEEIDRFMDTLLREQDTKVYNRILAEDERRSISPEAFSYLAHLIKIGSIDEVFFEKVISLSLQLNIFLKRRINKKMMDDIVNFIVFSGQGEISVRDLLDVFFVQESEIDFDDEYN